MKKIGQIPDPYVGQIPTMRINPQQTPQGVCDRGIPCPCCGVIYTDFLYPRGNRDLSRRARDYVEVHIIEAHPEVGEELPLLLPEDREL